MDDPFWLATNGDTYQARISPTKHDSSLLQQTTGSCKNIKKGEEEQDTHFFMTFQKNSQDRRMLMNKTEKQALETASLLGNGSTAQDFVSVLNHIFLEHVFLLPIDDKWKSI